MTNNTNQFLDLMKSYMNPEFLMNSMKNPSFMNNSSFTDSMKKNAEILTNTNQKLNDHIQSLAKKNAELLQSKATEMFSTIKDAISTGDVKKIAESQNEYVKSTIENSMNNAKEIIDLTSKASIEIFNIINQSMTANIQKDCGTSNSTAKPKV